MLHRAAFGDQPGPAPVACVRLRGAAVGARGGPRRTGSLRCRGDRARAARRRPQPSGAALARVEHTGVPPAPAGNPRRLVGLAADNPLTTWGRGGCIWPGPGWGRAHAGLVDAPSRCEIRWRWVVAETELVAGQGGSAREHAHRARDLAESTASVRHQGSRVWRWPPRCRAGARQSWPGTCSAPPSPTGWSRWCGPARCCWRRVSRTRSPGCREQAWPSRTR